MKITTNAVYLTLTKLVTYCIKGSLVEWPPVDSVHMTHPTLSVFSHASYQMSSRKREQQIIYTGLCVQTA